MSSGERVFVAKVELSLSRRHRSEEGTAQKSGFQLHHDARNTREHAAFNPLYLYLHVHSVRFTINGNTINIDDAGTVELEWTGSMSMSILQSVICGAEPNRSPF